MSQPTAETATASTVTVSASGMTVTVTSDGAINVTPPPVTPPPVTPPVTPPPVTPPVTPPPAGTSTTVFFDDFKGGAGGLPNPATWNVINTTSGPQNPEAFGGGDQEQYLSNPALIALDGTPAGNLIFTVGAQGTLGADPGYWPAPRVDTFASPGQFDDGTFATHGNTPKVAVLPGQSVEFSAKVTPLAGLWPSLWFTSPGTSGGTYPSDYYEFDLMESGNWGGGGTLTNCTAWGPGAAAQQNLSAKVGTPRTPFSLGDGKYHTYRLDYYTNQLVASVDGVPQYSITQAQVNAAFGAQTGLNAQFGGQEWPYDQPNEGLCIVMNCAVNQNVAGTTPAAASLPHEVMAVDWVRVYSPAGPYAA
jgi:hypothetical protein